MEYARTESFCANEIKISAAAERSEAELKFLDKLI